LPISSIHPLLINPILLAFSMQQAAGQTRRGRLADAPPATAASAASPPAAAADPHLFIQDTVANKPAAIFSKVNPTAGCAADF
jgi:hypothetical protein